MKNKNLFRSLVVVGMLAAMSSGLAAGQENSLSLSPLKKNLISGGKCYSDFETEDDLLKAGNQLNEDIAGEGIVLLKNEDGALPYQGVKRVSIFGKNSASMAYGGSGSGSGSTDGAKTIFDSLTDAGFEYNPALKSFYEDNARSGIGRENGSIFGYSGATIGETPIEDYDRSVEESLSVYSDAAIIVITRTGGEGFDHNTCDARDFNLATGETAAPEDHEIHYLELSKNEKAMIQLVEERFSKITVVINSATSMELGTLKADPKIQSMLWLSTPGATGVMALGRILNGTVNPSGRLIDIYSADFRKDPTFQNFGTNAQTSADGSANYFAKDKDGKLVPGFKVGGLFGSFVQSSAVPYVEYEEGIYTGYRYYETRGHEEGEAWYQENVVYPFGYGLSYTTFTQEIVSASPINNSALAKDGKVAIDVKVTNSGTKAGKDTVQLYYTAPYTSGGIEKSYVVLGAFGKTNLLQPNQSQTLSLTIDVQDMASYDYLDSNKNGHSGYELDAGDYEIKLMNNSHDVIAKESYTLGETVNYDTDKKTGNKVENRFTGEDSIYKSTPYAADMQMTEMSRADFAGTFPKAPDMTKAEDRTKDGSKLADRLAHVFSLDDIEGKTDDPRYKTAADMEGLSQIPEATADADRTHTLMLKDMVDVDFSDTKWDTLLNELKYSEINEMVRYGQYHVGSLDAIGKPSVIDSDGPASIYKIYWGSETLLAATFNTDLIHKQGQMVGNEALFAGKTGWYGPAMNSHRSPFGGRNFEYFSEDPLLAGKIAASEIQGAQQKGVYSYCKHFALNDQETSRQGVSVYCNEQAMRELYLKPFQYSVQEGESLGVMSSFNKIGNVDAATNYALLTQVLRDEWGFKGAVVTDGYSGDGFSAYMNLNNMLIAGGDLPLGDMGLNQFYGSWSDSDQCVVYTAGDKTQKKSYSYWYAMRRSAKGLLYAASRSNEMNNLLNTSAFQGEELTAAKDIAYTKSLAVSAEVFGTSNQRYEVTGGKLPAGLTLSREGVLSGTATESGDFTFEVTLRGDFWVAKKAEYTMHVVSAFDYTGSAMDSALVGQAFSGKISSTVVAAGKNNYSSVVYGVADGSALPDGLAIDEDGNITGTPTKSGTYATKVMVTAYVPTYNFWVGKMVDVPTYFYLDYTIQVNAIPHQVTFNANYTEGKNTQAEVLDGKTVTEPVGLVRDGYIFTGWYTDSACTKKADFSQAITAETTFYAGWSKAYSQDEVDAKITESTKTSEQAAASSKKLGIAGLIVGIIGLVVAAGSIILVFFKKH
jgi:beta-glucosidase